MFVPKFHLHDKAYEVEEAMDYLDMHYRKGGVVAKAQSGANAHLFHLL
jgi:hypothetical protein